MKLSLPVYPLAPSTWGAGEEVSVTDVVQSPLFAEFGGTRHTSYVPVVLEPNAVEESWRVRRLGNGIVGEIAQFDRARYVDLERVHQSQLLPMTLAAVKFDAVHGKFAVDVILPPPQLAVPRNNAGSDFLVLPSGDMAIIDTERGEFSAEQLASLAPGQWFVGLQVSNSDVVVTLGERVLGCVSAADVDDVRTILFDAPSTDNEITVARAFFLDGMAALDIADYAEATDPLWLRVPDLTQPESNSGKPFETVQFPDGSWAVTVDRSRAATPSRPKTSTADAKPAPLVDTDTVEEEVASIPDEVALLETSSSDDGDYLTEVQKAQRRRSEEAGRHRKP